jgi:putative transposase
VWSMDITYVPMARGFVYLAAVVDWFSRKVLSWRLSVSMDSRFRIEAVEEALARYGKPLYSTRIRAVSSLQLRSPTS